MIHQRTAPAATRVKGNADADGTYRYFYSDQWQILEIKDGSNLSRQQWVYGTQYVDEIVLMDNNSDLLDSDCDPDETSGAETFAIADARYFYHQDRNWNVIALTAITLESEYVNGDVVERYAYTPYGERTVLAGAAVRGASTVGSPFGHQGLPVDQEKGSYQNRNREYSSARQRFYHRDPYASSSAIAAVAEGLNLYQRSRAQPVFFVDTTGLCTRGSTRTVPSAARVCDRGWFSNPGVQRCNDCQVCPCGQFMGGSWVSDGEVCGTCVACNVTPPAPPPCPTPYTPPPESCCLMIQNISNGGNGGNHCQDCCAAVGGPAPPPNWQIFVEACFDTCPG